MRRGNRWVAAARSPDGTIVDISHDGETERRGVWKLPVFRGVAAVVESVRTGLAATKWSREVSEPDAADESILQQLFAVVVAVAVLAAFIFVPVGFAALWSEVVTAGWSEHLVEGVTRIGLLLGYLVMLGRFPAIGRTFEYHGAEHMVIDSYERHGTVDDDTPVDGSIRHPRCGTELIVLVLLVSIVVFSLLQLGTSPLALLARVALLPLVGGVAYELVKWAANHDNPVARSLSWPGLFVQRLTTREPSPDQIDVARTALRLLVDEPADSR